MSEALADADIVFVDTNFFVAVGGPDDDKYQALRTVTKQYSLVLKVPQRVEAKLQTMQIADRFETAIEDGWAELIDPPAPTDADAVN